MAHDARIEEQAAAWAVRTGDPAFEDWEGFTLWLERDPAHVLRVVMEGKVSVGHAAAAYGVVIDEPGQGVLQAETDELRASRR